MGTVFKDNLVLLFFPSTGFNFLEPPFGLVCLATNLKANGFNVKIVDCRIENFKKNVLFYKNNYNILFAGISVMTGPQIHFAIRLSKFLKKNNIGPLVWGGIHVSILPEESIESPYIDYILKGYADNTIVEFTKSILIIEKEINNIDGIVYRKGTQIFHNQKFPDSNINNLPSPNWSLIDIKKYTRPNNPFIREKTIYLFTSRGCKYSCTFCYSKSYKNKRWEGRSANQISEELNGIEKLTDYEVVFFHDDNFSVDKTRVEKVVRDLKSRKKKYVLSANISDVDEEYIALLSGTGCIRLDLAIESGSQKILALYKKGFTLDKVLEVFQYAKKYNLHILTTFMIGHPEESDDDVRETISFIDYLRNNYEKLSILDIKILTPYPGTEIFDSALKKGFIPPCKLSSWGNHFWNSIHLPWGKPFWLDLSYISLFAFRINHLKSKYKFTNFLYYMLHKFRLS